MTGLLATIIIFDIGILAYQLYIYGEVQTMRREYLCLMKDLHETTKRMDAGGQVNRNEVQR